MRNDKRSSRGAVHEVNAIPAADPYGPSFGPDSTIKMKAVELSDDLKFRVEKALERRTNGDAKRICVLVEGNTVILTGKVRSWAMREAARAAAWAAIGVGSVADRLIISY